MSQQDFDKKYPHLWDVMQRDFTDFLDAETFNEFQTNLSEWAGPHSSEATQKVGAAIWNILHEPSIVEAKTKDGEVQKGHYRNRFTGKFASKEDFEAQSKK